MSQVTSKGNASRFNKEFEAASTENCPKCGSDQWVRIRRGWWQKFVHSRENRCYCLNCQHKFWRVSHWR